MTFTKRPLAAGATLGDRLRNLRTEAQWSLLDVSRRVQIAEKYLLAIEETRYRDLPGLVYARQFVRRYAEALETDVEAASALFEQEYQVVSGATVREHRPLLTQRVSTEFPWVRRHIRLIVAGIVVLIVASYLGVQAVRNFLPPKLELTEPAQDLSTTQTTIIVAGATDPFAAVTINDQDVQLSNDGTFRETVDLHPGLNTLQVSAVKKHSQPRVVVRQVLVEANP